jgi:hypothetical protein
VTVGDDATGVEDGDLPAPFAHQADRGRGAVQEPLRREGGEAEEGEAGADHCAG